MIATQNFDEQLNQTPYRKFPISLPLLICNTSHFMRIKIKIKISTKTLLNQDQKTSTTLLF